MSKETFMDSVISGKVSMSAIDDYVDNWHDGNSNLELHEFLGLTHDEYTQWVEKPGSLEDIIIMRRAMKNWRPNV